MWRTLGLGLVVSGAAGLAALFFGMPHTQRDGLSISPAAGYAWRSERFWPQGVVWSEGKAHPQIANIVADASADDWIPRPGYDWRDAGRPDACAGARRLADQGQSVGLFATCLRLPVGPVDWASGRRDDRFPHVETTAQEGKWRIDDGYRAVAPQSLRVVWTPNLPKQDRPHLISGATEGDWRPEPGYVTRSFFFSTHEAWVPGSAHPSWPHVVADSREGYWAPEAGYALVRQADGSLVATALRNRGREFWIGLGVALAGQGLSTPREEDGFITREILRPTAREARDAGLRQMGDALR